MSSNDIAFSHGSEAIREAIIRDKLKAPNCSIKWQTEEKDKLLNQLRYLNFNTLLSKEELPPSRDLEIYQHMQYKFNEQYPNLSIAKAKELIAEGAYVVPDMTIDQQQTLFAKQNAFNKRTASLCSFLFKYCENTKISHLAKKYTDSNDYISFYEDIVDAYEKTGKNAESQKLHDELSSLKPHDTDCAITDFAATLTEMDKLFEAIEKLPAAFRTNYSVQNKLMFVEKVLYRDKKHRFDETLIKISDGKIRSWTEWQTEFNTLLSAYLTTKANSNQNISSSVDKLNQIKNETVKIEPKIDLNVNLTEITEHSLNTQLQQLKNIKHKMFPVDNPNVKQHKRKNFNKYHKHKKYQKSNDSTVPKNFDHENPMDYFEEKQLSDQKSRHNHHNGGRVGGRGRGRDSRDNRGGRGGRGRGRDNYRNYDRNYDQSYQNQPYYHHHQPIPYVQGHHAGCPCPTCLSNSHNAFNSNAHNAFNPNPSLNYSHNVWPQPSYQSNHPLQGPN